MTVKVVSGNQLGNMKETVLLYIKSIYKVSYQFPLCYKVNTMKSSLCAWFSVFNKLIFEALALRFSAVFAGVVLTGIVA